MLRVAAAVYLMLVTAAGPAVCCCTLARLTTRLASSTSVAVPKPASCCHHGRAGKGSKDRTDRPCSPGTPEAPGCPCGHAGRCEVIALPAAQDEMLQSSARAASGQYHFFPAILATEAVPPACVSSVFRGGFALPSSVSTDDLLYAFHILRC